MTATCRFTTSMRTVPTPLFPVLLILGLVSCGGPDREVDVLASSTGQRTAPAAPVLTPDETKALRFAIEDTVALRVEAGTVRSGQSLSHLLSPAGVSAQLLHVMATEERDVFKKAISSSVSGVCATRSVLVGLVLLLVPPPNGISSVFIARR